jgi:hypothetical protein
MQGVGKRLLAEHSRSAVKLAWIAANLCNGLNIWLSIDEASRIFRSQGMHFSVAVTHKHRNSDTPR